MTEIAVDCNDYHEMGIAAAIVRYDMSVGPYSDTDYREAVTDIITDYLKYSNSVILPREPTTKMLVAAAKAMSPGKRPTPEFVSNSRKHRFRYLAMVDAYKDFFAKDETQRE